MRKPKFLKRILDWFIKFELDLPKTEPPVLVAPPADLIPFIRKFPILRLPFVAQKHVLLMLKLKDLIPLSFLSKRSKRMIKQALPFKKAQYACTVWSKEVTRMYINSRFGSYTCFEPYVHHILDLLNYPLVRVVVDREDAVNRATEWVKSHQHCEKEVMYLKPSLTDKNLLKLVNQSIELNVRIVLDRTMLIVCNQEEGRIVNPSIWLMQYIWGVKCRKLRLSSTRRPIGFVVDWFLHDLLLWENYASSTFNWTFGKYYESSMVEQLVFVLRERGELDWKLILRGKKSEEEWQHPIYGEINEWYKLKYGDNGKESIIFETHHDGKRLLVVVIGHAFGLLDR